MAHTRTKVLLSLLDAVLSLEGNVIQKDHLDPAFQKQDPLDVDRHGSFLEVNGQWYYACNDRTHGGTAIGLTLN